MSAGTGLSAARLAAIRHAALLADWYAAKGPRRVLCGRFLTPEARSSWRLRDAGG